MKIREKIMIPVSLCYLVAIALIYFGCKTALSKYGYGSELNRILFLQVIVVGVIFGLFLLVVINLAIRKVLSSLREVNTKVGELSKNGGDLTAELTVSAKDESSEIASNMNVFLSTMREMLGEITAWGRPFMRWIWTRRVPKRSLSALSRTWRRFLPLWRMCPAKLRSLQRFLMR